MFGLGQTIPRGKKVTFDTGNPVIDYKEFELDSPVQVKANSTFKNVAGGSSNTAFTALAGVLKDKYNFELPVSFKQLGFQQWESTEPVSMQFTIKAYMENNALQDVVQPMQALMSMCVPKEITGGNGGLVAPGPALYKAILNQRGISATIFLGPLTVNDIIMTSADVTFANEVDTNDLPIWASANISIISCFTATDVTIANLFVQGLKQTDLDLPSNDPKYKYVHKI